MQVGRGTKRNMEDWEAAVIKALLADPAYTRDQIVAYFTRPDRTVNPFRISEIAGGKAFGSVVAYEGGSHAMHLREDYEFLKRRLTESSWDRAAAGALDILKGKEDADKVPF